MNIAVYCVLGSIHWWRLPFFGEDTELCQDVCKFEVVVEMTAKFSVTLLRVFFTDLLFLLQNTIAFFFS